MISRHSKFKGIMDTRRTKRNVYYYRQELFTTPFALGPCLISDVATRKTFLLIPEMPKKARTVEQEIANGQAWRFWMNHGAQYVDGQIRFDLTGKPDVAKWLERAIERFNELWTDSF